MMLRVHILSKELTYIKLKIVLCSLQDIHEFLDLSPQPPTLVVYTFETLLRHLKNALFCTLGAVHKRRRQFLAIFDPLPP